MEEKNYKNFARCLATFKDITLHAVKCKALKFTRLMLKKKKNVVFYVVSWEGAHYCHVGPKRKKRQIHTLTHKHAHISDQIFINQVHLSTRHQRRYFDF